MKTDEVNVNYLNVSCDEIFDVVKWKDAKVLISLVILAFINVAVIVGNCLVIAAVFISTKLRTVTNLFIGEEIMKEILNFCKQAFTVVLNKCWTPNFGRPKCPNVTKIGLQVLHYRIR